MILIAETDVTTADLEKDFLSKAGYDVMILNDGRKLLEEAQQGNHELIILSILLPRLNGIQVCKALKKDRRTAHIPVLFLSLLNRPAWATRAGADMFILKPFEPRKLVSAVHSLIEGREQNGQVQQRQSRAG